MNCQLEASLLMIIEIEFIPSPKVPFRMCCEDAVSCLRNTTLGRNKPLDRRSRFAESNWSVNPNLTK